MRTFTKVSARLIAAVLAFASIATVAEAQEQPHFAQVNVPFAFETATGQHLQPGLYKISLTGMHSIMLRNATDGALIMIGEEIMDSQPAVQGKAVFTHYGNSYYLRSLTATGSARRFLFGPSKAERKLQVAAGTSAETMELAVLQNGR